jgi:hypothetical protein
MSENYRYYATKIAERRARHISPALDRDLRELLTVVRKCEAIWTLEERIDRAR